MSKHTPGPWMEDGLQILGRGSTTAIDGYTIATMRPASYTVCEWNISIEEARANKRLILAAPELLDALKALSERHHGYSQGLGECICDAHEAAKELITRLEAE